jgi:hypothetical protein
VQAYHSELPWLLQEPYERREPVREQVLLLRAWQALQQELKREQVQVMPALLREPLELQASE